MCGIIKKRVRRGSKLKDFLNFAFFRSNAGFKKLVLRLKIEESCCIV